MMRIALVFIALISQSCLAFQSIPTNPIAADRAVEVNVMCETPAFVGLRRYMLQGSGVLVDDRRVLTAYHVVECEVIGAMVELADKRQIQATVDRAAPGADLAVLRLDAPAGVLPARLGPPVSPVACMATARPERRVACGDLKTFDGRPGRDISVGFPVKFGNSGSGIWSGDVLVGILTNQCADKACGLGAAIVPRNWLVSRD